MLNSFWNWFVILISVLTILACWWLLHWTKGVSDRKDEKPGSTGHVWDENITELNTPLPRWWLHLFNITIVFALVYLVFFPGLGNFAGVLGWTQEQQYQEEMAAAQAAEESVFARYRDMEPAALMADADAMATAVHQFPLHQFKSKWAGSKEFGVGCSELCPTVKPKIFFFQRL